MNATERMTALIAQHGSAGAGDITDEKKAVVARRMADARNAVEQMLGLYWRMPERFDALGAVVLVAKSVAPESDAVTMLLAAAIELLAEQTSGQTSGGSTYDLSDDLKSRIAEHRNKPNFGT